MKVAVSLVLLFWAAQVSAHDLYLRASPYVMQNPGQLRVSMELVEKFFPGDKQVWRGEKTSNFKVVGPNGEKELPNREKTDPALDLNTEGTYVVGWEGIPSFVELKAKEFKTYLELEAYNNVLEIRKKTNSENQPGKEKYSRSLKTIVQSGRKPTNDFGKPLGFKIEIVPLQNPYQLHSGDRLKVKLLFDGQPLAGKKMMATYGGYSKKPEDYAQAVVTDSKGIATFDLSKPGMWMIKANHMLPLKNDPQADWHSYWSNVTFEILNSKH